MVQPSHVVRIHRAHGRGGPGGAGGAGDPQILTASPEKHFPIKMVLYFFALLHIFERSAGIQPSQGLGFDVIVLLRHCCLGIFL